MSALFNLQNGFNVDNGKMSTGLLFGRKAFVGLTGGFGAVTAGRQQDTLQDLVLPVQGNNFLEYFTAPGDVDNADGSIRNSNAVKWVSPSCRWPRCTGSEAWPARLAQGRRTTQRCRTRPGH
ncbi:putative porin [Burkholderia sp. 572]